MPEEKPQIFGFLAIKTRGQSFLKLWFSWEFRAHPHVNLEESRPKTKMPVDYIFYLGYFLPRKNKSLRF